MHGNGRRTLINLVCISASTDHPRVVSVFLNEAKKLHTTRSWEFLGVADYKLLPSQSIWKKAKYGEHTIIGNLDTGN